MIEKKIIPGTHVIQKYTVSDNTIKCECGWKGPTSEHQAHRKKALADQKAARAAASLSLGSTSNNLAES